MAEQVGKFLTELPELETPTDGDLMYIVDAEASTNSASKKITMSNLKRVLGGNVTGTVEGASVSFSDGADGIPMKECEVTLTPSQDLHGYSKPWAGGAGKNKLKLVLADIKADNTSGTWSDNVYTINGATFTVNVDSDGNITSIDGIGNGNNSNSLRITFTLDSGSYILSSGFNELNGLNDTFLQNSNATTIARGNDASPGQNFTLNANDNVTYYFRLTSAVSHLCTPMIRESTAPSGFEPYSNICPISGHTDVTVTVASTSGGSGDDTTVSLGRTVYKGTVDLATGEGTITGASIQINPNDITFSGGFVRLLTTFSPITNDNVNEYLSSHFKAHINASVASMENEFTIDGNKYMILKSSMLSDLATAQAFFTNNTVDLFGLLATPQTFTLTKEQIITLLGQNYVSHDGGGNIKVVYIRDLDITINDLIDRVTALENE